MIIIGLSGKKQSGKDLAFKYMKKLDKRVRRYAFADNLKKTCQKLFGFTNEQIRNKDFLTHIEWRTIPLLYCTEDFSKGEKADKKYLSIREILQIFGTDICRNIFDPHIWVKATFKKIHQEKPKIAVITDARFLDEIQEIKKNNGIVFRIIRDNLKNFDYHKSEIALDKYKKWDGVLLNNGTKKDFQKLITSVFSKWIIQ